MMFYTLKEIKLILIEKIIECKNKDELVSLIFYSNCFVKRNCEEQEKK